VCAAFQVVRIPLPADRGAGQTDPVHFAGTFRRRYRQGRMSAPARGCPCTAGRDHRHRRTGRRLRRRRKQTGDRLPPREILPQTRKAPCGISPLSAGRKPPLSGGGGGIRSVGSSLRCHVVREDRERGHRRGRRVIDGRALAQASNSSLSARFCGNSTDLTRKGTWRSRSRFYAPPELLE